MEVAWTVTDPDEDYSVIIFDEDPVAARRLGATELICHFHSAICERSPQFDLFNGRMTKEILRLWYEGEALAPEGLRAKSLEVQGRSESEA